MGGVLLYMRSISSALCFLAATALHAQSLLTGPTVLTFTTTSGGSAPASQNILIRATGDTPRNVSLQFSTNTGGNWLSVSALTATTPARISVTANPTGLPVGTYSGTVLIGSTGLPSSRIDVTFNVVAVAQLTASPSQLAFQRQAGSTVQPTADEQTILINSTGSPTTVAAATTTTDGGTWLQASTTGGTPGTVTVRVNSTGLAAGTYNGSVNLTSQSLAPVSIPVTLTVSANPILTLSQSSINFAVQRGSSSVTQSISLLTTNNAPISFTTSATTAQGTGWLIAAPALGTAPGQIDVSVNPAVLTPGTYTGSIQISAPTAANPNVTIPVTVTVSDFPIITALPRTLSVDISTDLTQGAIVRELSPLAVTSSAGATPFTTSVSTFNGGAWLVAGPGSGATTSNVTVVVDATGLPQGTYRGQITLVGPGNQLTVPVVMTVSTSGQITIDQQTLTFNYQKNQTPPSSQIVNVTSSGAQFPFVTTVTSILPANGQWLTGAGTDGTTPASLTFGLNPTAANALAPGQYTATVAFQGKAEVTPPLTNTPTMNVVLNVSETAQFNVSASSMDFVLPVNGNATQRFITLTTTDASARPFTISANTTNGGAWLRVDPVTGNTPANLAVQVFPLGLAAGVYTGTIQVTVPSISATPQTIRVRMVLQSSVTISPSLPSVAFTQPGGGTPPAARTISLTASVGTANYLVTTSTFSGGGWLSVTPASGVTPGNLTVSVNGSGLAPGNYTGSIGVISADAGNSPLQIPVTLTITPPTLTVTPTSVTLVGTPGSNTAVTQALTVTAGANGFTASATTSNGGNWLSVTPATVTSSPGTVTISANPTGLAGGTYTGSVTITAAGVANSPIVVPVTFTVVAVAPAGRQILSQIADGAGWKTTIILMNLDIDPAPYTLRFFGSDGAPLRLSFEGSPGRLESLEGIIPVGGSRTIVTQGLDTLLSQGWAELTSTKLVNGLGVFRQRVAGRPDQEAAVSAIVPVSRFVLPYDNTQGFVSSMALANTSSSSSRGVTVTPRAEEGTALIGDAVNLPAQGHIAFAMADRFPSMASRRGAAEFQSSGPDFAALGLRFNTGGAFTSLPTLEVPLTSPATEQTRVISQVADGSGWKTTITLVNLDTVPADYTVRFWRQDGVALQVPLNTGGALDTIQGTIPVGGTRVIETLGGTTALVQGWAQLTTTRNVNGLAVFRQRVDGRPDQEAAVTLTTPTTKFAMPFDNTTDFVTSMALVNTSATLGSTVTVVIRDESGAQIGSDVISLGGRAYLPFALTSRFASTLGRRGTVEFSSTSLITGLGLRFNSGGAFTSFPVSVKR